MWRGMATPEQVRGDNRAGGFRGWNPLGEGVMEDPAECRGTGSFVLRTQDDEAGAAMRGRRPPFVYNISLIFHDKSCQNPRHNCIFLRGTERYL